MSSDAGPRFALTGLLTAALALAAPAAAAQDEAAADKSEVQAQAKAEAQARMDAGSLFYRQGDFEGALAKFNEAHALFPSPKIYFNIGQALRKLDRLEAAVEAFERFLAEAKEAAPEARKDAQDIIDELRPKVRSSSAVVPAAVAAVTPPAAAPVQPTPWRRRWPWTVAAGAVVIGAALAALLITREGPLPMGTQGFHDARMR